MFIRHEHFFGKINTIEVKNVNFSFEYFYPIVLLSTIF